jgi:dTDP-4-dehydrorhamnose reductase
MEKKLTRMRILVIGSNGLLGSYVVKELQEKKMNYIALNRIDLDITSFNEVAKCFNIYQPEFVINCAAYTNVQKAESNKKEAFNTNVLGISNLVFSSNSIGATLLNISTDFVFDGIAKNKTYKSKSRRNPLNYYGYTKYIAEQIMLTTSKRYILIRTSWLYGRDSSDFVSKIHELAKRQKTIRVVNFEYGSPTYAKDLAKAIVSIVERNLAGVYHLTNEGYVSRFDFAKKIIEFSGFSNDVISSDIAFDSVIRPKYVKLDNQDNPFLIELRKWDIALEDYLSDEFRIVNP